jgi:hypothetical protein
VEREILKRYFEQTSPTTEIKAVEDWLLDPGNKIAFEKFLEEEWSDHVQAKELSNIVRMKKSKSKLIWKTASAAAVLLLAFGMYQSLLVNHKQSDFANERTAHIQQQPSAPSPTTTIPQDMSDTVSNVKPIIIQHEKKEKPHKPKAVIAQIDPTNQGTKEPTVLAKTLTKAKINEAAMAKLIQKIDSNQLVFDVNVSDAAFLKLAYIFRNEYGIILELCNNANPDKTYTAQFKKISIHDLLDDMSEKMLFSYTFQDNKVKICFN